MENNKRNNTVLFAIIIILLLATISLLVYSTFFRKEEKKEEVKKEVLTTNSYIVQHLYSYIKDEYNPILSDVVSLKTNKIYMKDMDPFNINLLGLTFMPSEGVDIVDCDSKYDSVMIRGHICGYNCAGSVDWGTNGLKACSPYTMAIDGESLKKSVETIFGKDLYTANSFGIYVYYSKDDRYIATSSNGGGVQLPLKVNLLSVTSTSDSIVLTINIKIEDYEDDTDFNSNYNVTYKLDNGNYYLYLIEKA